MALATNSSQSNAPGDLRSLAGRLERVPCRPIPLLVFRVVDLERTAWRDGRTAARRLRTQVVGAFSTSCRRILRVEDAYAQSDDLLLVALISRSRHRDSCNPRDTRTVMERLANAIRLEVDVSIESGWLAFRDAGEPAALRAAIPLALEKGARERERFAFFAAVGHELRTPLTSIRGYLETLLERRVDPRTKRRFLETARRETERLGRFVEEMLEFSLLDLAGDACNSRSSLLTIVHTAAELVAPLAGERSVVIEVGRLEDVEVAIDEDRAVRILVNVLHNAAKHGASPGRVRIETRLEGDYAWVSVHDDGPGTELAEREALFTFAHRGKHAQAGGSGLGLSLVKTFVERAGGSVGIGTSVWGGARFDCSFLIRAELPTHLS